MDERGTLCVFAKPPRPGEVKTRLAETLGAESAAALARAFFLDTWRSATSRAWARAVLATTDTGAPEWAHLDATIWPQGGGDLGERMERALLSRGEIDAPETARALHLIPVGDGGRGCA